MFFVLFDVIQMSQNAVMSQGLQDKLFKREHGRESVDDEGVVKVNATITCSIEQDRISTDAAVGRPGGQATIDANEYLNGEIWGVLPDITGVRVPFVSRHTTLL